MRLLLDTHVVIAASRNRLRESYPGLFVPLTRPENSLVVSVVSIWEIAIKVRIKKLTMDVAPPDLPRYLTTLGATILPIDARHAIVEPDPEPRTRDPFDRMLLAQCMVEGMKLVTVDRALNDHPFAWQVGDIG